MLEKAANPQYRLKLGMGKPYGLGSIAITSEVFLTDRKVRYSDLFNADGWNDGIIKENVDQKVDNAKKCFNEYVLRDERVNPNKVKEY